MGQTARPQNSRKIRSAMDTLDHHGGRFKDCSSIPVAVCIVHITLLLLILLAANPERLNDAYFQDNIKPFPPPPSVPVWNFPSTPVPCHSQHATVPSVTSCRGCIEKSVTHVLWTGLSRLSWTHSPTQPGSLHASLAGAVSKPHLWPFTSS